MARAGPRARRDCAPSSNGDATTSDRPPTPPLQAARARRSHSELSARDFLDLAITAGTVVGVVLFLPTRVALGAFYGQFGLTPEEAGVTYTDSVTSVTVLLAFLATCVVLLVWVAVYLLDSFPVL